MIVNKKILIVEPDFPIPAKSKNHKNFLPIGLLKIASYLRANNNHIKLIRGEPKNPEEIDEIINFKPDEIWMTSLFTYWAKYVKSSVQYYKNLFPHSKIVVGGIFASLLPEYKVKKITGCDEVYKGVMPEAEKYSPAYDLSLFNVLKHIISSSYKRIMLKVTQKSSVEWHFSLFSS